VARLRLCGRFFRHNPTRQIHHDYLVKALKDYKSGARKNPIMAPMVANLTARDIEDLAAYYSSQKGLVLKY